ncbi:MAG: hypothetical protein KatS3mg110_3907 [Pirellulaceae bacterium]|nr:MAG: hypothetical protein KatS3mg110_3907 [Pirellulaceae bacterium]
MSTSPLGGGRRMPCVLCDEADFRLLAIRDRRGHFLRTVICRHCGLVRHWHVPTEEELDAFYAGRYREEYHGEYLPSARRVYRAWRNGQRLVRLLRPHIGHCRSVFEIGAGIGCTVKAFEMSGWDASGLEPHRGFSRYAREVVRADVACESLWRHHSGPIYDLLLLVHVIEHLRQPIDALARIRSWCRPGGLLYVECPNLAAPFAAPGKWFHYAHIYNFTPKTLTAAAARAGWAVVRWLSRPRDPVLALLLTPGRTEQEDLSNHCDQIVSLLRSQTWFGYHVRFDYIRRRAEKLSQYVWEYLTAPYHVRCLQARWATKKPRPLRRAG